MKNLSLLTVLIALGFTSCSQRYTQNSKEIDSYKKLIAAYNNQQFDEMALFYSDTAKIMFNVPIEEAQTVAQSIAQNKLDAALFSSWKYNKKNTEYEMVVTDAGETWVNFWSQWEGTLKQNNKLYVIPSCITAQFVDGKIVREIGYWDLSKVILDLQKTKQVSNIDSPDHLKIAEK